MFHTSVISNNVGTHTVRVYILPRMVNTTVPHLHIVGGVIQKAEHDGKHLLAVVQDLGLAVLRELSKAEARALAHVRAGVQRKLQRTRREQQAKQKQKQKNAGSNIQLGSHVGAKQYPYEGGYVRGRCS